MSIPSLKSPEDLRRLRLELLGVSVYRKVLVQPVSAALLKLMEAAVGEDPAKLCESWGALCSTLAQTGRLDSLPAAVAEEVLRDDNAFSAALSAGEAAAPLLEAAALRDLRVLYRAAQVTAEELASIWEEPAIVSLPRWGSAPGPRPHGAAPGAARPRRLPPITKPTAAAGSSAISLFSGGTALCCQWSTRIPSACRS